MLSVVRVYPRRVDLSVKTSSVNAMPIARSRPVSNGASQAGIASRLRLAGNGFQNIATIPALFAPSSDCPQIKQRLVILRTSILLMGLESRPNRGEYLTSSSVRRARESVSKK